MYIKLIAGKPTQYSLAQLKQEHTNVSFPNKIDSETLLDYGVYAVTVLATPEYDKNTHYPKDSGYTLVGGEWTTGYVIAKLPIEHVSENIRKQRTELLTNTDWMALSDVTLTPEVAAYREALRNITAQEGFPHSVSWPTL
jgi:hypothetical protein